MLFRVHVRPFTEIVFNRVLDSFVPPVLQFFSAGKAIQHKNLLTILVLKCVSWLLKRLSPALENADQPISFNYTSSNYTPPCSYTPGENLGNLGPRNPLKMVDFQRKIAREECEKAAEGGRKILVFRSNYTPLVCTKSKTRGGIIGRYGLITSLSRIVVTNPF